MESRYIREPQITRIMERCIPWGARLLEIGCGQGLDLVRLCGRSGDVTAIDCSDQTISRARRLVDHFGISARLEIGNAERLRFEDGAFDAVYSYGVMHHTARTQDCIDEAYRVLRPGGVAVIMLYRFWSPIHLATALLRWFGKPFRRRLVAFFSTWRFRQSRFFGNAPAEIFGAPVTKGYSARQLRMMFRRFSSVKLEAYQVGFHRLAILAQGSPGLLGLFDTLENALRSYLGHNTLIIAKR